MRAFMTFLICTKLGLWRRPSQFWLILATTCLRCSSSFHLAGYSISTCRTDYANSVVVFFVYLLCAFCWYKVKACRINQLTPIQRQIPPTDLRHTHTPYMTFQQKVITGYCSVGNIYTLPSLQDHKYDEHAHSVVRAACSHTSATVDFSFKKKQDWNEDDEVSQDTLLI